MLGRVGLFIIFVNIILDSRASALNSIHHHSQGLSQSVAKRALEPKITGETEGGIVNNKSANHGTKEESQIEPKETPPVHNAEETKGRPNKLKWCPLDLENCCTQPELGLEG